MSGKDDLDVCSNCRKPRQSSDSLAISQRIYVCNCDRTTDGDGLFEPEPAMPDNDSSSHSAYHTLAYQQLEFNLKSSHNRPRSWLSKNATAIIVLSAIVTIACASLAYTELFSNDTKYDAELNSLIAESEKSAKRKVDSLLDTQSSGSDIGSEDLKFTGYEHTKIPNAPFLELQKDGNARDTLSNVHFIECTITDPKAFNAFAQFPKIEGVTFLHCSGLTEETMKNICQSMPLLASLSIEFSDMNGVSVKHIAALHKLEDLYLRGLLIHDQDIMPLLSSRLIRLDIGKTQITDEGLFMLAKLKNLRHLRLMIGNGISKPGLERFRQMRADCKIKLD